MKSRMSLMLFTVKLPFRKDADMLRGFMQGIFQNIQQLFFSAEGRAGNRNHDKSEK